MRRKTLEEIVAEQARQTARDIFEKSKTVGLACDNMRRSLKLSDCDPNSDYFRRGRSLYSVYVTILTENVNRIFTEHGMTLHYNVPKWEDPFTMVIL